MPRHGHVRSLGALGALTAAFVLVCAALPVTSANAATSALSGTLFHDLNRNGVHDSGEQGWSGVVLHLMDSSGSDLVRATTAADGSYGFPNIADGSYNVVLDPSAWWDARESWVQTSGRLDAVHPVTVAGASTAPLAWRPIVRSTDDAAPISSFTGPEGLRVQSFNDVVPAKTLYDVLATGLLGAGASSTRVTFGLSSFGNCPASVTEQNGRYSGFAAVCAVSYSSWLDAGPQELSHEYGHAWSLYNAFMTQQDPTMAGYVSARGLTGDSRLNTSYQWSVSEMIAEDYRQLLGAPAGRTQSQINYEIPLASQVAGLGDYLRTNFSTAPAGSGGTTTAPTAPTLTDVAMNPTTVSSSGTATFTLSSSGTVNASVLDNRGKVVATLASNVARPAGSSALTWNRITSAGKRARTGSYTLKVGAVVNGVTLTGSAPFSVG